MRVRGAWCLEPQPLQMLRRRTAQIEDLAVHGLLIIGFGRGAAGFALRCRQTIDAMMNVLLRHHGPRTIVVPGLTAAFLSHGGLPGRSGIPGQFFLDRGLMCGVNSV
jgi:hypothetical protein